MCLCLASSLHSWAQVDISAYFLENHGFDTNFNYDARQTGNVSGDVINEVYGWTNETTATYTVQQQFRAAGFRVRRLGRRCARIDYGLGHAACVFPKCDPS